MIRGPLTHPGLLGALAAAGHGSQVLIADALYPHATGASQHVPRVHLNLRAGLVAAADVLSLVAETVHVEAATFMLTADGGSSAPVREFQSQLQDHRHGSGQHVAWSGLPRNEFYAACRGQDLCLLIATGEVRPYANLLLTVGVP